MKSNALPKPIEIPPELRSKVNNVKRRILFLSPSVMNGQERECRKDDFESLANSNIGVGGFGKVYKVRHKASKNIYAIKVINKAKIIEHDLIEQIKLEVEIMYKLDNKYIVKLFNHYEDDDSFYLILEFAPKGQIYTRLKRESRFSERVAAQFIREVVEACKYLHSQDPPIIHRDIKPENILLDAEDAVKLADFGWSNFFNENRERMTYCGTPEYLAPEMIRQSGHDKSLDIWNLGVLLFELLTGNPPFVGKDQKELFDNILHQRIQWPRGFSRVAKDLISKLLKPNPQQRMQLNEICDHPWFRNNAPIRPVITLESIQAAAAASENSDAAASSNITRQSRNITIDGNINNVEYQVISKPQHAQNLIAAGASQDAAAAQGSARNQRQSVIEQKLAQIQKAQIAARPITADGTQGVQATGLGAQSINNDSVTSNSIQTQLVQELNQKLIESNNNCNSLKVDLQLAKQQLEQSQKENVELKAQLKQKEIYSGKQAADSQEVKRLQDEINRLTSLTKNRDQLLVELTAKTKSLRESETALKIAQNELELAQSQSQSMDLKSRQQLDKIRDLEHKVNQGKEQAFNAEKLREQQQVEYENKLEVLKQKLLAKIGDENTPRSGGSAIDRSTAQDSQSQEQFIELMGLCRSDLSEILEKLRQKHQADSQTEDQLRSELIAQGKQMNDLRAEHERTVLELKQQLTQKAETDLSNMELEHRQVAQKLREDLVAKEEKVKHLEKQEIMRQVDRAQSQEQSNQLFMLQERLTSMQTDRDLVVTEKQMLLESVETKEQIIQDLRDQVKDFEVIRGAM